MTRLIKKIMLAYFLILFSCTKRSYYAFLISTVIIESSGQDTKISIPISRYYNRAVVTLLPYCLIYVLYITHCAQFMT